MSQQTQQQGNKPQKKIDLLEIGNWTTSKKNIEYSMYADLLPKGKRIVSYMFDKNQKLKNEDKLIFDSENAENTKEKFICKGEYEDEQTGDMKTVTYYLHAAESESNGNKDIITRLFTSAEALDEFAKTQGKGGGSRYQKAIEREADLVYVNYIQAGIDVDPEEHISLVQKMKDAIKKHFPNEEPRFITEQYVKSFQDPGGRLYNPYGIIHFKEEEKI